MAFYPELKGPPLQAYNDMVNNLLSRGATQLNLQPKQLVLRSLIPEDVGLSSPVWSFSVTSTNAFNTIIDAVIQDNRFIGINGIFYDPSTELISELRLTRMGALKRQWNIQEIPSQDDKVEYVDDPIIVDQTTTLKVEAFNQTTSTDGSHEIGFKGAVVEKRGLLIA